MLITEVTASWTETANLGNYSNIKPSLTLKATVLAGQHPETVANALMNECRHFIQELVDQALEQEGQAAKYSQDPRFDILYAGYRSKIVVIVPTGVKVAGASCAMQKHRYAAAQRFVEERYNGHPVFICLIGDADDTAPAAAAIAAAEAEHERQAAAQRAEQEAAWERERAERQQAKAAQVPAGEVDPFDDGDDDDDDE